MKLLIGADLVPTSVNEKFFEAGDVRTLFGDVCDIVGNADRFIVNLECALTNHEVPIKKFGPNIKCTPECINAIKKLGVTDVCLSNNHVFDFGIQGLCDTMEALDNAGLPYTGVGENDVDCRKPYFIDQDGKRVGIINVSEHEYSYALPNRIGVNPFDPFLTMADVRETKKLCDYLVVIYHGGKEYCRYPSPRLYNLAHELVHNGADAVICQHSHAIGCYEQYEGAHILYGQGNFNFVFEGYDCPECWYTGLLVELETEKNEIKFHPILATEWGCDLAQGDVGGMILSELEKRSESLKDGTWLEGWSDFCHSPEMSYYYDKMKNAGQDEESTQWFAHYIDCEAHTDVWRELFPTWNMTNELES